jgi:hypothetical protein
MGSLSVSSRCEIGGYAHPDDGAEQCRELMWRSMTIGRFDHPDEQAACPPRRIGQIRIRPRPDVDRCGPGCRLSERQRLVEPPDRGQVVG